MSGLSDDVLQAVSAFGLDVAGEASTQRFGHGLIHQTWRVDLAEGAFVAQRLNSAVFAEPALAAENAAAAAGRIDSALRCRNDEDPRHRLFFLKGPSGKPWFLDDSGYTWRLSLLIPNARPADPGSPCEVKQSARALGRLPGLLAEGEGPPPRVVLSGFHDTAAHFLRLLGRVESDPHGRLASSRPEVDCLLALSSLTDRLSCLELPERVVHNDAKLDNVLVEADDGTVLCVVDLDTVQPGLAAHDFGDLVRSAVTGRPEDEADLGRVMAQTSVFRCLAEGYLEGAARWITPAEKASLVDGVIVMTFEQAVRFLADFLTGDVYYPVADGEHNLRRARAQICLLRDVMAREREFRRILGASSP